MRFQGNSLIPIFELLCIFSFRVSVQLVAVKRGLAMMQASHWRQVEARQLRRRSKVGSPAFSATHYEKLVNEKFVKSVKSFASGKPMLYFS